MADNPGMSIHIGQLEFLKRMNSLVFSGDIAPEQLTFTLPPSKSHILWLTGHLAASLNGLMLPMLGAKPAVPPETLRGFGRGTPVSPDAADYASYAELKDALDKSIDALIARLREMCDADLDKPVPPESPLAKVFPTLGVLLSLTLYHTGYHSGQISLLRRAQGLPSGIPF